MTIPVLTTSTLLDKMSEQYWLAVGYSDSLFASLLASAIAFLIPFVWLGVMAAIANPFIHKKTARSLE